MSRPENSHAIEDLADWMKRLSKTVGDVGSHVIVVSRALEHDEPDAADVLKRQHETLCGLVEDFNRFTRRLAPKP